MANPADQQRYGDPGFHPPDDPHPPAKTDKLERDEQRSFVNWCLLKDYAFCWHSTHKRSTANLGVPDFIVGLNTTTLWIEFKRVGEKLSKDQEEFKERLMRQGIVLYVVHSAQEAIALTTQFDEPVYPPVPAPPPEVIEQKIRKGVQVELIL